MLCNNNNSTVNCNSFTRSNSDVHNFFASSRNNSYKQKNSLSITRQVHFNGIVIFRKLQNNFYI